MIKQKCFDDLGNLCSFLSTIVLSEQHHVRQTTPHSWPQPIDRSKLRPRLVIEEKWEGSDGKRIEECSSERSQDITDYREVYGTNEVPWYSRVHETHGYKCDEGDQGLTGHTHWERGEEERATPTPIHDAVTSWEGAQYRPQVVNGCYGERYCQQLGYEEEDCATRLYIALQPLDH